MKITNLVLWLLKKHFGYPLREDCYRIYVDTNFGFVYSEQQAKWLRQQGYNNFRLWKSDLDEKPVKDGFGELCKAIRTTPTGFTITTP
jgi:hypothetical protein